MSQAVKSQQVRKLMVIGLGTTGTDICNILAQRVEEDFGDVERVPWIDYYCFETDGGKGGVMKSLNKLHPLTIDKQAYSQLISNTSALDSAIDFSSHWDITTLSRIKDISSGVGNVRMAGRLAFFYPSNFDKIDLDLKAAIERLRDLTEVEAMEQRGVLPGGANPEITFLAEPTDDVNQPAKNVVIAVVGTLCGGTGSGLCVDLGYYLRERCPYAHVVSIFTLPRADLSSAAIKEAERYKVNAYSALRELHHYAQKGDVIYTAKYSTDAKPITAEGPPYEMTLLGWPRESSNVGPMELNSAVAERLLLLGFSQADPFPILVNVPGLYKDPNNPSSHPEHTVFGSIGMASIEYPGPRIVDYCAYRMLANTFDTWSTRQLTDQQVDAAVGQIDVTWDRLRADLLNTTESLDKRLQRKCQTASKQLTSSPDAWKMELDHIGAAFGDSNGPSADPSLERGCVPAELASGSSQASAEIVNRTMIWLNANLLKLSVGPGGAIQVVDRVIAKLMQDSQNLPTEEPEDEQLRNVYDRLSSIENDWPSKVLGLYKRAAQEISAQTLRPLNDHVSQRIDASVARILMSSPAPIAGRGTPGVMETAWLKLQRLRKRLTRVQEAGRAYAKFCQMEEASLVNPPTTSGRVLTTGEQAKSQYRKVLASDGDDVAFQMAQQSAAQALLTGWDTLQGTLQSDPSEFDVSLPEGDPHEVGKNALPDAVSVSLLRRSRDLFTDILRNDVIQEWFRISNKKDLVAELQSRASSSLAPDLAKASELLKPSRPSQQLSAIVPGHGSGRKDVEEFERLLSADLDKFDSPSWYRASVLKEYYGLPLESIPGIVRTAGANYSLEQAEFTTWDTSARKNSHGWQPISTSERSLLNEARRLLAIAIVLDFFTVRNQRLAVLDYTPQGFNDVPVRELPNDLESAARRWALSRQDLEDRDLSGLEGLITGKIATLRSPNKLGDEGFVRLLRKKLDTAGAGIPNWNQREVTRQIEGYCKDDRQLAPIVFSSFGPSTDVKNSLYYRVGESIYKMTCERDGYYCINPVCGGRYELGFTEQEAARRGWKCGSCNTQYHSLDATYDPAWIRMAQSARNQGHPSVDVQNPRDYSDSMGTEAQTASYDESVTESVNPFHA